MHERDKHRPPRTIIGWREYVSLPDWGIPSVVAKIDTGARTSALHVENLQHLRGRRVRFDAVLSRRAPHRKVRVIAHIVRVSRVRPSTGRTEERFVVSTTLRLGGFDRSIELSLVSRKHMLCRLLLGRTAIDRRFLIDPARRYALGRPLRRRAALRNGNSP